MKTAKSKLLSEYQYNISENKQKKVINKGLCSWSCFVLTIEFIFFTSAWAYLLKFPLLWKKYNIKNTNCSSFNNTHKKGTKQETVTKKRRVKHQIHLSKFYISTVTGVGRTESDVHYFFSQVLVYSTTISGRKTNVLSGTVLDSEGQCSSIGFRQFWIFLI